MNIITVDMETYYAKDFTLSKLTTEEYVRDERFEVIGVSVQINDEEPVSFSGTMKATGEFLNQFDWENSIAVAHNAIFDMAILSWHFKIIPKKIADTLSMARALHNTNVGGSLKVLAIHYGIGEKGDEIINALGKRRLDFTREEMKRYMAYCCNDTAITYKLFAKMAVDFPIVELNLIDLTIRMFTQPVLELDAVKLSNQLVTIQANKEGILDEMSEMFDCGREEVKKKLMSNIKFAEMLDLMKVPVPMKISPATNKETYAFAKTDEGFKALLEHDDPMVQALASARVGTKSTIEESRTKRFLDIQSRGLLPIPLKYYAAHTGRWGGCLVADTEVMVYNKKYGEQTKRIVDVLLDDLVWDGEDYVEHEGVAFSGYSEVIKWDGVEGTEDHVVFTDKGEISLLEAMQGKHRITTVKKPKKNQMDSAREHLSRH